MQHSDPKIEQRLADIEAKISKLDKDIIGLAIKMNALEAVIRGTFQNTVGIKKNLDQALDRY